MDNSNVHFFDKFQFETDLNWCLTILVIETDSGCIWDVCFWSNMLLCPSIALQGKWKIQISRYFCLLDGTLQTSFLNSKLLIMVSTYKKTTTKNKSTSQVVMSSSCVCQYRLKWIRLAKQISLSVLRSLCLTKPILVLLGGNVIVKTNVSIAEIFIMTSISLLLIEVWMTLETY
jgi:hypothetical protein